LASITYRIQKFWKKITGQGDVVAITKSLNKMVVKLEKHHSFAVAEAEAQRLYAETILAAAKLAEAESSKAINAAKKIAALFDDTPPTIPTEGNPAE
jgi:hypothetical protein